MRGNLMKTPDAALRCRFAAAVSTSVLLLLALACTPTTGVDASGPLPSILVTNGTCGSGGCAPLEIRAFPGSQPRTPGGFWSVALGTVAQEQACLRLHRADTFRVIGERVDAPPDTTYIVWRVGDAISLAGLEAGASALQARPGTEPFKPRMGSGWSGPFERFR